MTEARRITVNATHKKAHLEELGIVWVFTAEQFKEQVQKFFIGADSAGFIQLDDLPEGTTREYWEAQGYNFFGRWGGEFDEHATPDQPRKEGESALSLVAKKFGIENDPKFVHMLKWISWLDLNCGRSPFHLGAIVKMMNDYDWDSTAVMEWTFTALNAIYAASPKCFGPITPTAGKFWGAMAREWMFSNFSGRVSVKEFDRILAIKNPSEVAAALGIGKHPALKRILEFTKERWDGPSGSVFEPHMIAEAIFYQIGPRAAKEWVFKTLDVIYQQAKDYVLVQFDYQKAKKYMQLVLGGRKINIVVGESSSLQFSRFARSAPPKGCWAAVVVCKNPVTGNVTISTGLQFQIDLASTVALLRTEELRARGLSVPSDLPSLQGENNLVGDVWYFFEKGRMILNGSTTRTMPPTALNLDTITGILFAGIGVGKFKAPAIAPQQLISASAMASA